MLNSFHANQPFDIQTLDYHPQARGAVVGGLSSTNREFQTPVELQDALGLTPQRASTPWQTRHPEYAAYASGLVPVEVPAQFNVQEAAALVEMWAHSGSLHSGTCSRFLVFSCTTC